MVPSTSSRCTIDALRTTFATHGLPEIVVSDNGTAYTSAEFQEFTKRNGIRHITSSPYHPSSNGLAERAVQTFKEGMRKGKATTSDLQLRLTRFLFQYRITPHSTTGISPAELLMNRRPRSQLDLMHPSVASRVVVNQERQKAGHDRPSVAVRTFSPGDTVYVRESSNKSKWLPGVVAARNGPLSYEVTLSDDHIIRRHVDHIRSRSASSGTVFSDDGWSDLPFSTTDVPAPESPSSPSGVRRSTRVRAQPDRYDPSSF